MKINNNYAKFMQSLKKTENKNKNVRKEPKQEIRKTNKKSVEIKFSKEARELSKLSEEDSNNERIEAIKTAINNDQYEIDPKGIVKGITQAIKSQKGMK